MDIRAKKEFEVYEMKLKQWMNSDIAYAIRVGGGGWDFLIKDMNEKFWDWMFPALRRIYECGYCSQKEFKEYISKLLNHIHNFSVVIQSLDEEEDDE